MKKRKKKRLSKGQKKFFIIASCYIAIFLVTAILTATTLSWFNGSTWSTQILYMGGPVYIDISDDDGNITHGLNSLVMELPPNWGKLYPGMNIKFEAKAVVTGQSWIKDKYNGETTTIVTTGCVLRAKVLIEATTPNGTKYPSEDSTAEDIEIARSLYRNLWPQIQAKAQSTMDSSSYGRGKWVFDFQNSESMEENYFYYVESTETTPALPSSPLDSTSYADVSDYKLVEVGGVDYNVSVGFLNNATITLAPLGFVNEHADCSIKFTIVFQAVQAFLPYEDKDLGSTKPDGSTVKEEDLGIAKPRTIGNSRRVFAEAVEDIYKTQD